MGNYDHEVGTYTVKVVIPLREKMGNYDENGFFCPSDLVIPLREKMGNYDGNGIKGKRTSVIPLREKMGNNGLPSQTQQDDFLIYYIRIFRFRQSPMRVIEACFTA